MKDKKPIIELDGRTGEGGGQLVRIACALAAVATQPIRITHVRGNREGHRGGGLKSQHVTAIDFLATATGAEVAGLSVGSHTLEFRPRLRPSEMQLDSSSSGNVIKISADSPAASTLLIFQAVFPFLLFACGSSGSSGSGSSGGDVITLEISGGTNVAFSLSYEYLDQVLLPALQEAFGIAVERRLLARGWSVGRQQRGRVEFRFRPLRPGEALTFRGSSSSSSSSDEEEKRMLLPNVDSVEAIDVSMVVPAEIDEPLRNALVAELEQLFPDVDVHFRVSEDSGADARVYVLLVAKAGSVRWGRDKLTSMPKKAKGKAAVQSPESFCAGTARGLVRELYEEVSVGGVVDEFLQDQLVVFQALADGRTSFPRGEDNASLERAMGKLQIDGAETLHRDKTDRPFGEGSTHTTTARWVTTQLLPGVKWYNKGSVCEGVGMRMGRTQ